MLDETFDRIAQFSARQECWIDFSLALSLSGGWLCSAPALDGAVPMTVGRKGVRVVNAGCGTLGMLGMLD